jgi:ubiquinone/menaquinone biosynthesis C-methylase UbiE
MNKTIKSPEDIDWEYFWEEKLKSQENTFKKDWNKEAPHFAKRVKQDEYMENLFNKMRIDSELTAIDLGCGEGSITIPLSKLVKNVTAVDSSEKMLEILEEKINKENIENITIINETIEDVSIEKVKKHDIVLASRSFNGIVPIIEAIKKINEIANKYVYITLFGPNNWKFERDFYKSIGKNNDHFAPYYYLFNILVSMGINPNVENLEIQKKRSYESVHDAMENGKWNLDSFNEDEKIKLRSYLKKNLIINEDGRLEHPDDKADWVLIWWKKE